MNELIQRVRILAEADTVRAVLTVHEAAARIGMKQGTGSALATAVSELATNVIKYAGAGRMTLRSLRNGSRRGIEVVVEDYGPGIADIAQAMTDRVSTGGTLGLGLPGTRRLVDEFELESKPGEGTRVRIVKWG
jgi:serine/threonine-protein kinase RsbT